MEKLGNILISVLTLANTAFTLWAYFLFKRSIEAERLARTQQHIDQTTALHRIATDLVKQLCNHKHGVKQYVKNKVKTLQQLEKSRGQNEKKK